MKHIDTESWSEVLQRGSALILTADARYKWKHGIDKRKIERDKSNQRERRRRVSLTFRTVIPPV